VKNFSEIRERVRRQYEQFPYPDYDPDWDRPQLLVSGHLGLMCEVLWAGKKSPKELRVLDAGCGTGSALVAMAMAFPDADIVGVDFSETSLNKARRLAETHNVKNVRFYNLAIEQLPELGLTFDFVSASGVLHHLPDPAAGLKAIGDVLDPQGAISIMLYGKYGRTGVYMLQEALRLVNQAEAQATPTLSDERIRFAYQLAQQVPSRHPMASRSRGREMQEGKEAGVVDLLLHANDIPFDVPAVYKMCQDAGMRFYRWLFPLIYNLNSFFNDPFLQNRLAKAKLSRQQQEETAELAHGRNSKHSFIAVRPEFSPPDFSITNGKWRKLHAKLTPCMAWNRTLPVPGKNDLFAVPFTIIQDAWGPLEISRWQLMFLGHIIPDMTLEQVFRLRAVKKEIPFKSEEEIDTAVEDLLKRALDRLAIVFLERNE
jgi:ubiquinone/menaquinone biosynthesis C-methylase UbiE